VLRENLHITSSGLFDGVALTTSSRPAKTVETLRDKLRKGIPLRAMQDITGLRIVGDLQLSQQDDLANEIKRCFSPDRVDIDDRRATPSHGYRAVHVIPHVNGLPVEIQIRTMLQDSWAQGSEKIGDIWGRWHRYGLPPEGPNDAERERRRLWIAQYVNLSDAIYAHEVALDREFSLLRDREEWQARRVHGDESVAASLTEVEDLLQETEKEIVATRAAIAAEATKLTAFSTPRIET
jgi:ppGpp synthetase/RelA/SpoT-type nucleotidyltranferase